MPSWSQVRPMTFQVGTGNEREDGLALIAFFIYRIDHAAALQRAPRSRIRAKQLRIWAVNAKRRARSQPASDLSASTWFHIPLLWPCWAPQSRKCAPAAAWASVRSRISASSASPPTACLMDGTAPLIFSPMIITGSKTPSYFGIGQAPVHGVQPIPAVYSGITSTAFVARPLRVSSKASLIFSKG